MAHGPRPLFQENPPPHSHGQRRAEARRHNRKPKVVADYSPMVQRSETLHRAWDAEDDFSRDLDELAWTARRVRDEEEFL